MLHAYVARFDITENLKKFLVFGWTKQGLRASIIVGCKPTKCWGGGEKRGERGEAGYKLTVSLGTGTRNFMREISGPCINSE